MEALGSQCLLRTTLLATLEIWDQKKGWGLTARQVEDPEDGHERVAVGPEQAERQHQETLQRITRRSVVAAACAAPHLVMKCSSEQGTPTRLVWTVVLLLTSSCARGGPGAWRGAPGR